MKIREGEKLTLNWIYTDSFKKVIRARVTNATRLEKSLGEKLWDAHCMIGMAISVERGEQGYPSKASYEEHIASTGELNYSEAATEITKFLRKWRRRVKGTRYMIAEQVCYENMSIRAVSRKYRRSRRTIAKLLREALKEWRMLKEYGEPIRRKKSPKRKPREEFKASKIVIFSDENPS